MSEPIRVLYLDHTAKLSGGEIALLRLLQALDRSAVEPIVVLGEDGPLASKLQGVGIETLVLELDPDVREVRKDTLGAAGIRYLRYLPRLLRYSRRIARLASERKVDVIHTNSLKSDIYGAIAAKMARLPLVWHIRDGIHTGYLPWPAVIGFRELARIFPDYVIANSAATLASLKLGPHSRKDIVFSGVTTNRQGRFLQLRVLYDGLSVGAGCSCSTQETKACRAQAMPGECSIIGIVGRIAPWKGQDVFLRAAEIVLGQGHAARFWIIGASLFGEEEFEQDLRRQADTGLLKGRVEFLGFRDDIQDLLPQLSILVHASTVPEPFGQVIIEGMAAGVPVIAADAGGPQEIITHGVNGLLTPPGDAPALAEAIIDLLDHRDRAAALARAGQEHVARNFSIRASAEKVERIYREIISSRQLFHQRL